MQREDEKNKKRKVEEESYEAQEKRPNIQREREREEGREEGSGNWDCLGEISGAPVPPWNEFQYFIFIIHTSLSLALSPLLSPSICISSLSMQAPPPPSPLWFPRKVALFYYILQQNEDGSNPNPCLLFLSVYIPFLFLL